MMRRELILKSIVMIAIAVFLLSAIPVKAEVYSTTIPGLVREAQGFTLPSSPDYEWWYGCSPTSAGMMMGYYDLNGYAGDYYTNFVPGGPAELSNFGIPGALANQIIASSGHVADFWVSYGHAGPDPLGSGRTIPADFDCLADFMGTSQASLGSSDGSSWLYNWGDGTRLYAHEMPGFGIADESLMYGLWEYEQYAGYGSGPLTDQMIYNQRIVGYNGNTVGFSWDDYKAEIDAGRPVMIQVEGHSMAGFGYDNATNEVILYDTWWEGEDRMVWGGYYSGMLHTGVTVFEPTGGVPVPVPAAVLLGILGLGAVGIKLRKYA